MLRLVRRYWERAAHRDVELLDSRGWLLERYWLFAWAILALSTPLIVLLGGTPDLLSAGVFAAITTLSWLVARKSSVLGARLHLCLMFPYWTWYAGLAGGVPHRLDAGVAEFVVMLVFPIMTLVTVEGVVGALCSIALGGAGLFYHWPLFQDRLEGVFLLSLAALIGLVFRRLARELDHTQARLRHMAYHDALTSLANRRELERRASACMDGEQHGALLFVDLDRFKTVNDVLGHSVGDEILRTVAERLREVVSEPHLVARIGGDEFAVLVRDMDGPGARRMADDIVYRLCELFQTAGRAIHVGASVGIALWPEHGHDLERLMRSADLAMYRAKKDGSQVALHRPEHDARQLNSRGLEVDMHKAIEDGELVLQFQPVVDAEHNRAVGAEALVRWQHPTLGLLTPGSFIELAEETGHVQAIDRWVLRQAMAQLDAWHREGWEGWIAVNLSARTVHDASLLGEVKRLLASTDLPPGRLVIELTESAAMRDPEASIARLKALHDLGVGVAIDDFGMGYSSLGQLKRFPADHVKIDRSFTNGIGVHERDEEVIELVLQLADKWNLGVIAEGVETEEQLTWLLDHGCCLVQGFHVGRPADPERAPASKRTAA